MQSIIASPPEQLPFWRRLWISQPFRFESKLSPEDYASAVQKFERLRGEFWLADDMDVQLKASTTSVIAFTIILTTRPKNNHYFLSRARGVISVDSASGRTIVTGSATLFPTVSSLLAFMILIAMVFMGYIDPVFTWVGLLLLAVMIIGPYLDRSRLINVIGDTAILGPRRHRHKSKKK